MNIQKINRIVTYIFVVLAWSPHAVKECVDVCNGPIFISPLLVGFFTPFVQLDMSMRGFLMQLIWSIPFIFVMWGMMYIRDNTKYGTFLKVYLVAWIIFAVILLTLYNLLFWGGLRSYIFPLFYF
ncbi:MAG: hypothetical protein KBC41_01590 [Candidatus Pacebacteria bacterium]|nr:hypothetical protein [Candidatus Paceibacterota bacterium]